MKRLRGYRDIMSEQKILFLFFLGILIYWYPAYILGMAGSAQDLEQYQNISTSYRLLRIMWISAFGSIFLLKTLLNNGIIICHNYRYPFIKLVLVYLGLFLITYIIHFDTIYSFTANLFSTLPWAVILFMFLASNKFS